MPSYSDPERSESEVCHPEGDDDTLDDAHGRHELESNSGDAHVSFADNGAADGAILTVVTQPHEREAAEWVATEIERLRNLSYHDLLALEGQQEHRPMETPDGKMLGLETQVFWDDRERRNLRVMVDVWDPAKRLSRSMARDDFIRAPNGSFVGE